MYTLKSIAQRGSLFGVAAAVVVATMAPAAIVFADALNPLTERSLLLSSSAPGYMESDGSGNTESAPNAVGEYYSPPGSGPNGKKTGETFTFNVSTDSRDVGDGGTGKAIKAFTLQYCTTAAGWCQAPGNNTGDARDSDRGNDSLAAKTSDLNFFGTFTEGTGAGNFQVLVNNTPSTGWAFTATNKENEEYTDLVNGDALTGKNNFVTLVNASGSAKPQTGDNIKIVFRPSTSVYITNPGAGAFFVKMNTYDSATVGDHVPGGSHNVDGGVTVANVMTDSIHITTKVLETMAFSVGTRNRDTVRINCTEEQRDNPETYPEYIGCESITGNAVHGTCDPIQTVDNNRLQLGNGNAEHSLETSRAWDVYSYWRLSSNSSGGATVYYSGNTLANTVGDEIREIGPSAAVSTPGTEQFGLGFVDAGTDTFDSLFTGNVADVNTRHKIPTLMLSDNGTPGNPADDVYLSPAANYANGTGTLDPNSPDPKAAFAFEKASNTIPRVIAQNNQMVISCATAKMRYMANIGADTPAGVYTTKINYLAAPQY